MDRLELTITDLGHQTAMRRAIGEHLADCGVCDGPVSDVNLVATELLTNAFEHGGALAVLIMVQCDAGSVTVHVAHVEPLVEVNVHVESDDAERTPKHPVRWPMDRPAMPPPHVERGRGLAIVDALTVEFATWTDDHDRQWARARIERQAAAGSTSR